METGKEKYDYIIKVDENTVEQNKDFHDWYEERRIENNMKADIEWLDKNKHLLYQKDYIKTTVLISIGNWKYFTPLWKILAYAILIGLGGLCIGWFF